MQAEKCSDGPGEGLNTDGKQASLWSHYKTGDLKKRQEQELIRGGKKLRTGAKKEWSESTEREERE